MKDALASEKSKGATWKLSGPAASIMLITSLLIPVITAATVTTTPTPIATPSTASAERIQLARRADAATLNPSRRTLPVGTSSGTGASGDWRAGSALTRT